MAHGGRQGRSRLPAALSGLLAAAASGGVSLAFTVLPSVQTEGGRALRVVGAHRPRQPPVSKFMERREPANLLFALSAGGLATAFGAALRASQAGSARGVHPAPSTPRLASPDTSEGAGEVVFEDADDDDDESLPPPPPPFDPAAQVGALEPVGFFDPLGFCSPGDEGKFRGLRAAELKHGRVAMLAAVGAVTQHYIRFPFFGFPLAPSGLKATYLIPSAWGFTLLIFASMIVELLVWTQDPRKEVGDFGDPLGLNMYDKDMRNRELNNGRFAMFAAVGIISAELLTGKDAVEQLGL
mmetsp:Transcript_87226/g.260209  ORF Transcript_87226/g.260209 Transcript_87226/m.260209 type:complete len:297 (+) Transcript_87226:88-978(+)